MLNKKDLQFITVDPASLNRMIIYKRKKEDILELLKSWFRNPELRPLNGTLEDYMLLSKEEMLEKISQMYNVNVDLIRICYLY